MSTYDNSSTTTSLAGQSTDVYELQFPFDPGVVDVKASTSMDSLCLADGDVIIDSGAGRGIKPTMHGLAEPRKASSRIIWGDGTSANATIEATVPGHDLPPFLVAPKASGTLVSVGANTEGNTSCYSFFDKHVFRIDGLQVFLNEQKQLKARIADPENATVKYIGSKPHKGGVYKAPSLEVFLPKETGSWRFSTKQSASETIVAGPDLPSTCHANIASTIDSIFADEKPVIRTLLCSALQQPDYVEAFEYDVADLNAHQQKMALQLTRKHNQYGHISRRALRTILQQSHIKADRELARHIDLQPICNCCLRGRNKRGPKHKLTAATPAEPSKFMQDIAIDNSGKQNIMSTNGFWYFQIIICKKTSFSWVYFLFSTADSTKTFEEWLREVPKQHRHFTVKTVRHDGGRGDFGNKAFAKLLKKYDITREKTGGTSTGNAKCERRIGIATTDCLVNMSWCNGPRGWWSFSIKYGVITRNLMPTPTNPGHQSPYEYAYNRKPNYDMLVPFGCLAFAVVSNIDKNGKTNYRRASRVCAMIGYTLKPDGHPLAYRLFDCDLGTTIERTNDLVTFNKDMPALKYIAERSIQRPVDLYANAIVAKEFLDTKGKRTLHWGKVISNRFDSDGELLFKISYEDGDSEEFNVAEMMVHTRRAAAANRKSDFTVPQAPKSRRRNKLSDVLRHATTLQPLSSTSPTTTRDHQANNSSKLSTMLGSNKLSEKIGNSSKIPNDFANSPTTSPKRRSARKRKQPIRLEANNCNMRPLQWTDVLKPRVLNPKTSAPLPYSSPTIADDITARVLINHCKQQQRRTHVNAFIGKMFDLSSEDGRKREYLKQSWAYIIACGAIVEPPPSSVPEIIAPPAPFLYPSHTLRL